MLVRILLCCGRNQGKGNKMVLRTNSLWLKESQGALKTPIPRIRNALPSDSLPSIAIYTISISLVSVFRIMLIELAP